MLCNEGGLGVSKTGDILLTVFLGGLGIDPSLSGRKNWNRDPLAADGGCLGIGWLVNFIRVCTGSFRKKDGFAWISE